VSEATTHQAPPHSLVPYVFAAAGEVLDGHPLAAPLKAAVEATRSQLCVERDAIEGGHRAADVEAVAAVATATSAGLRLANLALETDPSRQISETLPRSLREQLERASARLSDLIADLEGLAKGDDAAARRVAEWFGVMVDRLFPGVRPRAAA